METPPGGECYPLADALETFLVEWKHLRHQHPGEHLGVLETFLVEWKPKDGGELREVPGLLETFLVEWKHDGTYVPIKETDIP